MSRTSRTLRPSSVGYPGEEEEKEREESARKERGFEPEDQKDRSGAQRLAGEESVERRSWVEPEHQRDNDIPTFKHNTRQSREEEENQSEHEQAYQDHPF